MNDDQCIGLPEVIASFQTIAGLRPEQIVFNAWLNSSEPIYNQTDEMRFDLSWDGDDALNQGLIYAWILDPQGEKIYLAAAGCNSEVAPLAAVDLFQAGHYQIRDMDCFSNLVKLYGDYTLQAVITPNDPDAFEDPNQWLTPLLSRTFSVSSHTIPLTFGESDPEIRQLRVVQGDDGYWIGYTEIASKMLYLMKTNFEGRTLIPPFALAEVVSTSDADNLYCFALVTLPSGGLLVLTSEIAADAEYNDPRLLREYRFDGAGKTITNRTIMEEGQEDDEYYKDLWAARTEDGRVLFAARSHLGLLYGLFDDQGTVETHPVLPEGGFMSSDLFECHYSSAQNRFYLLYYLYGNPGETHLTRWTLEGNKDADQNISTAVNNLYGSRRPKILEAPTGLVITLPKGLYDDFQFLTLNFSGEVLNQKTVETLRVFPGTTDNHHSVLLDANDTVRLAFATGGGLYYTVFDLDGRLLTPLTNLASAPYNRSNCFGKVFDHNGVVTFFYVYDNPSRDLVCLHLGQDFISGQTDLVVAVPQVAQSPDYALLDSEVGIRTTVFNRGEATAEDTTLSLIHNGQIYQADVNSLAPGAGQTLEFHLPTPLFLNADPTIDLSLNDGSWAENNQCRTKINYPASTPIYSNNASIYLWSVQDQVTHAPVAYVHYTLPLAQVRTYSGQIKDIVLTGYTGADGQIATVLEPGEYSIRLSRGGYPTTSYEVTVPDPSSLVLELEPPGDLTLNFEDAGGGNLHPVPNPVNIEIFDDVDRYDYDARGDETGIFIQDLMPIAYNYKVRAFGYEEKTGTGLTITGGLNNLKTIVLTPLPRATLSGRVRSGSTNLSGANVRIQGTRIETASDADGLFLLEDIPYGQRRLCITREGYQDVTLSLNLDTSVESTGDIIMTPIVESETDLGHWVVGAWNQIEEVPGTFFTSNYKVTTTYGLFDLTGYLSFEKTGDQAEFNSLELTISGWKWYYYSVSTSFSLLDIAFSSLDELVSGSGDLIGALVDVADGGFFNFLDINVGAGGSGGETLVRVDRVVIYDGNTEAWDSYDQLLQFYSDEGTIHLPLDAQVSDINAVKLRIYIHVSNENYDIGPLFLRDKMMLEWHFEDGQVKLKKFVQNPVDYPTFEF
ncbi:MAG: carboxypeptidase regulatory-like domain-containing protein [Deltaproteobacteria bacterium]|nr:carboxypeptidase regulatory-like domain-containing protein [Deltaproteobacteria bacterium]